MPEELKTPVNQTPATKTPSPADLANKTPSTPTAPATGPELTDERVQSATASELQALVKELTESRDNWKTHARTWEERATENQRKIDPAIARATAAEQKLSDVNQQLETMGSVQSKSLQYYRELVATQNGIDKDSINVVLSGEDEETIQAQATAFRAAVDSALGGRRAESNTSSGGQVKVENPNPGTDGGTPPKDYKEEIKRLKGM